MGKILLLVDNSNIFTSGKDKFGENFRFSYRKFEQICSGSDVIIEKHLAGSTPPSNDAFWNRMKNDGYLVHTYERVRTGYGHSKEKAVDMVLGVYGGSAIEKIKPDRVVLLTGDRDFVPIAALRDSMKEEGGYSFVLDVWAFPKSLSSELTKVCDHTFNIEDYKDELVYFQYENGKTESFLEREERKELEKQRNIEIRAAQREKQEMEEKIEQQKSDRFWDGVKKAILGIVTGSVLIALGKKIFGRK